MRILLNVDDGKHWHPLARWLGRVAAARQDHVTVVSTQWSSSARAESFEKAGRLLGLPQEQWTSRSHPGIVEDALPREARSGSYDLVAVGRLGGLDWITNGLVSTLLVRRIPTSVLVVRGALPEALRRVLVLTAGPLHGGENLRLAARLARPFDAEVVAMHVLSQMPLTTAGEQELRSLEEHFLELEAPEAQHLRAARDELARRGVRGDVRLRVGTVVDETLAEVASGGYDLLIFGAHLPEHGTESFLYEDIAGLLVRASPVSFLVVRRSPEEQE